MKISNAYILIRNAIMNKTPIMIWGPPGVGKSSVVRQIAENEFHIVDEDNVLDMRLAQIEPTDMRGIPMPNKETGRACWFIPQFWPDRVEEDTEVKVKDKDGKVSVVTIKKGCCPRGPGLLFLDEIEKASMSVKNASLELVLDRRIGSYKLPDDWGIVAAGNREEDGCFSAPIGNALSSRMIHVNIEPDVDAWTIWAKENDIADDIIGFLNHRQELLYQQTGDNAFPSPRTWAMASSLIKDVKSQDAKKELLTASVGKGAALEFVTWSNVYKSVDVEAILNGKFPDFESKDQSVKYAVAMAVSFHLQKRRGGIKKIEQHVADFLNILTPELRVVFLKLQDVNIMEQMMKHPAFKDKMKEFLKATI